MTSLAFSTVRPCAACRPAAVSSRGVAARAVDQRQGGGEKCAVLIQVLLGFVLQAVAPVLQAAESLLAPRTA